MLKVGVVGGLGLMAHPMAVHWKDGQHCRVVSIYDRGTSGGARDERRNTWKEYGAEIVHDLGKFFANAELDGVFICAGKNADDSLLIAQAISSLAARPDSFVCHLSTVSCGFVVAADSFAAERGVSYLNYPLTGGPKGAAQATMLILASGAKTSYERLLPALEQIGSPRYFGERVQAAAEVKLIGHLMVFNSLVGVCSAAAVHAERFNQGQLGGGEQCEFMDFLNRGAGGSRQWELNLREGLSEGVWDEPFSMEYAAIDALYAVELCLQAGVSRLITQSILSVALAFSYILNSRQLPVATHALVRELIASRSAELDAFLVAHQRLDLNQALQVCIDSLPAAIASRVMLSVSAEDLKQLSESLQ